MKSLEVMEARREAIVQEMLSIRSMLRGTINEQYLRVHHRGQKEPVARGPYYVISRREGSRTVSQRLTSKEELERARREVAEHKRFVALCREFEEVTEKLGERERSEGAQEKKGPKLSSSRRRR